MTYQRGRSLTTPYEPASRTQRGSRELSTALDEYAWLYDRKVVKPSSMPRPKGFRASTAIPTRVSRRLTGLVWFATGLGICVDGIAVSTAPQNYWTGLFLFWSALAIVFVVYVAVLLFAKPSRALRQLTVTLLGVFPAVLYRMASPLVLGGFDEHLHERTLLDLLHGSGLFAPNSMLPVSPDYPGMELFTGTVIRLTGLPVMLGMALVPLLFRLLLVQILYHSALTVSPSHRVAALVVIFYSMSPQFYFFNSQFAYQTMALTLGLGGLLLLRRAQFDKSASSGWLTLTAVVALIATVITHHITSWFVAAFLLGWTAVTPQSRRRVLVIGSAAMLTAIAAWMTPIFNKLINYFGPVFLAAFQQLEELWGGTSQRKLFNNSAGVVTPEWQSAILILYAVVCSLGAVICAFLLLRRALRYRDGRLGMLGFLCLGYPVTLAAHFLPQAASLGDRASTFLFLPLALSGALVVTRDKRLRPGDHYIRRAAGLRLSRAWVVPLVALASLLYLGGVFVGGGPDWEYLPGPYLVSADFRGQDADTIAAVRWVAMNLPAGSRIVADRVPADLLASEAQQWLLTTPSGNLEPALLYFSNTWGPYETRVVQDLHINYLYVDQRLSESLPQEGYYVSVGETPQPERLPMDDLAKFAHVKGLSVVYHRGPVIIYDTVGLGVKPDPTGFTGERSMGFGGVGDALCGVAIVAISFAIRRRLSRLSRAARDVGTLGMTIVGIAATALLGLVLFGLRIVPGPSFTVAALVTGSLVFAVYRLRAGSRFVPKRMILRSPHPLAVLGVLGTVIGLVLSFHTAWTIDVTDVDKILGVSIGVWNP